MSQDMPLRLGSILETSARGILIPDALMPKILATDVLDSRTRVRIWTNHETEPDDVVIALG